MGKYQKIREIIRETVKDGKVHTAEEFEWICEKKGISLRNNRGPIYNVIHQLKQKGEVISDGEKGYMILSGTRVRTGIDSGEEFDESVNLSDFEVVKSAVRKASKQIFSVFANGDVAINKVLTDSIKTKEIEIRIKTDCSQLLIIPNGKEKIDIGKNSRFKNYEIVQKLQDRKIKLPAYYVGEWNEKKEFWLGELTNVNPNKTAGKHIRQK